MRLAWQTAKKPGIDGSDRGLVLRDSDSLFYFSSKLWESMPVFHTLKVVRANQAWPMDADASLCKMASAGRMATVVALVREGSANMDGVDANGQSALAAAAQNGHAAVVAAIYALKGLSLHAACAHEDVKRVCALIKNKANVDVQDVEGTTVLMATAVACQSCIVELVLAAGASCEVTDKESRTGLMIALANKHADRKSVV